MSTSPLAVAIPWSLSHYIHLNGFNPLYRALFDACPENVTLNAWDNILLSATLRQNPAARRELRFHVSAWQSRLTLRAAESFKRLYYEAYDVPNLAATALLPGDIELHHTGLFPSMTRPFVLHCDSFAALFTPFTTGSTITNPEAMRAHYSDMLENPLCLGIFSHIRQTLDEFSQCFQSKRIDGKLFESRIGILQPSFAAGSTRRRQDGAAPVFLFTAAGPDHVMDHGSHIVLQAWPAILAACPGARLYLCGTRPDDAALTAHGADSAFIARETGKSLIWIPEYLTSPEILHLLGKADFLLLPSIAMQPVAIMQAMALGAVPAVLDGPGTTSYISDGETGIVLHDVSELAARITSLWQNPTAYTALQARAIAHTAGAHDGARFAQTFWAQVQELWAASPARAPDKTPPLGALQDCLVTPQDWPRLFESPPQPLRRLYTGAGLVTELGGSFIATPPGGIADVHGWSVFAEYCRDGAVPLRLAASIDALEGAFMGATQAVLQVGPLRRLVQFVSLLLSPYPILYHAARKVLRLARRLRGQLQLPAPLPVHDVQLLKENVAGMNVLRCDDMVYAIPQDQGEFSLTKLRKKYYRVSFSGTTLRQVLDQIAAYEADPLIPKRPTGPLELLEEGFHGLNLLRYGDVYLAIPQGEGAFDYDRVLAKGYSRSATASSLAALKTSIIEVLS